MYPVGAKVYSNYQQQKVVASYRQQVYEKTKNSLCQDVMGVIEIPKIDVKLPIYDSTDEDALQKGVGHLKDSDLPAGGEGSHCVLTGHRGLPSATLFTRLDEMEQGDRFYLRISDEILAYEVSEIFPMIPKEDLKKIHRITAPVKKEDMVTLITCTPYGVNTHRLLVQGKRVAYKGELESVEEDIQEKTENRGFLPGVLIMIAVVMIGGVYRVKKIGVLLLCGLLSVGLWAGCAKAADGTRPETKCSLTVKGIQEIEELPVDIYCVATYENDGTYQVSSGFEQYDIDKLTKEPTTEEIRLLTEKIRKQASHATPLAKATLKYGICRMDELPMGIYLVVPGQVAAKDEKGMYRFMSSLVELPQGGNAWDVNLQLKGELEKTLKSPKTGIYE